MASRTYQPTDPEAKRFEDLRKKNLEKPLSLAETRALRDEQQAEGDREASAAAPNEDKE